MRDGLLCPQEKINASLIKRRRRIEMHCLGQSQSLIDGHQLMGNAMYASLDRGEA